MRRQLGYLGHDIGRMVNREHVRYLALPFTACFYAVISYRLDRGGFEVFGEWWRVLRLPLLPLFFFCQSVSNVDIHYRADIGRALGIMHPALGVVVSQFVVAGECLTLEGGNCVGGRPRYRHPEAVSIGDYVAIGANATVLPPATLGDRVRVGAGAVVLCDVPDYRTAVGVPARVLHYSPECTPRAEGPQ